jgi:hypothetical protein
MSKDEFIAKAKVRRIDFGGNVEVDQLWDGFEYLPYYAAYADKEGIHAYPPCFEDFSDDVEPIGFDEIEDEVYDKLINDIIDN